MTVKVGIHITDQTESIYKITHINNETERCDLTRKRDGRLINLSIRFIERHFRIVSKYETHKQKLQV